MLQGEINDTTRTTAHRLAIGVTQTTSCLSNTGLIVEESMSTARENSSRAVVRQ